MTYAEILTEARRLARVSTQGLSDSNALSVVSKSIKKFSSDVGGFRYTRKLQASGTFVPETFEGFHIEIVGSTNNDIDSDVAITSASSRLTGTEMAAMLQVQIRAAIGTGSEDLTVAWSNFYFTIDAIDSTSIEISAPSAETTYIDATTKLFGGVDSEDDTIVGGFPEGCTVGSALPTGCRTILGVSWDQAPLVGAEESMFRNPQSTGTPGYYYVSNMAYILLYPVPTSQHDLTLSYYGIPTLLASPATTTELPTEIPPEFQDGIANKVAEELLLGTHETRLGDRMRGDYEQAVTKYILQRANNNTEARIGHTVSPLPYYVVGS